MVQSITVISTPVHNLFHTCDNFRPRSLKVRSPGHAKGPHLIKSLNASHSYTEWPFTLKLSVLDICNSIYKMFISEFWYWWPKVRSILWPLHCKLMGEKWKVPVLDENHLKHLNIRLPVNLTPKVGILRPVTPHLVAMINSGHERSPAVFRK